MKPLPAQRDGGDAAEHRADEPHAVGALRRRIAEASGGDPVGRYVRVDGVLLDLLLDSADQAAAIATARSLSPELGARAERLAWAFSAAPEADFLARPAAESFAASVADPALTPGDAVGEYRVAREVGRGGMGVVYLAERPDVGLQAAVKVLSGPVLRSEAEDPDAERFLEERRHLAGLCHPNVARLYDAGFTADGRPYFAMEHVDGEPVTTYADRRGLRLRDRLSLFGQVCAAVRHAHGRGVVHGDVKPENVLVADDDEGRPVAKLLDFGVATRWRSGGDGSTTATWRPFTYGFAAPEIVAGGEPSRASDVYALGALLYELAGPYLEAEDPLRPVIARAMSDDVGRRPPSVADLSAELRALAMDAAPGSPVTGTDAGGPLTPRVQPWVVGVALGAVAALVGAAALGRSRR
ncbi:MAG: serine/threonine-protein kinase [Bacteroidota bacterium]